MKTRAADLIKCIECMEQSNKQAVGIFRSFQASAVTDISGFGLAGHCAELVQQSNVNVELNVDAIRLLPGTLNTLKLGVQSTLYDANAEVLEDFELSSDVGTFDVAPLVDPQTSGGLLAAIPRAATHDCLAALVEVGYDGARVVGHTTNDTSSRILKTGT